MKEQHYRSIIKAISWRIIATLTTVLIVFLITNELVLSISIGVIEVVLKVILYYFHERIWIKIKLGQIKNE